MADRKQVIDRVRQRLINGEITQDQARKVLQALPAESEKPELRTQPEIQPEAPLAKQKDASFIGRANQAILDLPGGKTLAELAAASNRTMFDIMDFFGPDNVNAILELAGSEKRVPTFGESLASEGGYMEEGFGRDIVQGAGEMLPAAAGAGAAMRGVAGRLPAFSQGEGAAIGTVRQMGAGTAGQDVATGLAAGAGSAAGQEVGGDTGEMVGSIGGALATGLPGVAKGLAQAARNRTADKLFKEAAPTPQQLKNKANTIYKKLDDMGVTVKQPEVEGLSSDIINTVRRSGFNPRIHPKVAAVLDEVAETGQGPKTLSELDILRRVARSAASSIEPDEQRIGRIIIDKIDDFLDDVPAGALQGADKNQVGTLYRQARGLWGKAKRSELIGEALEKADLQASGLENGIRVQFRQLLNNRKKIQGFSSEERAAMRTVVEGTDPANMFKALGRLGVSEGQATNMLSGMFGMSAGGAAGAAMGGPVGAAIGASSMFAIGQASRKAAQTLTKENAKLANALVRTGGDGREVARAYMRTVPPKQRSVRELTGLLLNEPGIKLKPLVKSNNRMISDAALAAGMIRASQDSEKETEQ